MRKDTASLIQQTVAKNCDADALVNNRLEGNALLTIQAIPAALEAI